ncbi:MAG: CDP-diacylglycerol--serine O-phosphatidyltransferase [Candidatus Latescibacteria bacterium]|nr:CDP-diacylglycerol--serine O-phosphatidyltransferase [Candidatus Latescibacterota bacterium]
MSNRKAAFPAVFTLGNLLCGFLSVLYAVDGKFVPAAWLIIVAWFMDGFDGKVARLTHSSSRFGVELDSLADLCSFGWAPTVLIFRYRLHVLGGWGIALSFLFLMCGALRLARFNVQVEGFAKKNFTGLPIPAAAWTIAAYTLFGERVWGGFLSFQVCSMLVVLLSFLMVSTFEYDALLFTTDSIWNRFKLIFAVVGALAIIFFPHEVLFPMSLMYMSSGIVRGVLHLIVGEDQEIAEVTSRSSD